MRADFDETSLRFIEASHVQSPAGKLQGAPVYDMDDRIVGSIGGILVDPAERRLRFFVVEPARHREGRQYLLPSEWPAQIDPVDGTLRVDMADDLTDCDEFDFKSVPPFSDDDLLAALFGRSA